MNNLFANITAKTKAFCRRYTYVFLFAIACIMIMALIVFALKNTSTSKSYDSIELAIFLSGMVSFSYSLIAWILPARDEGVSIQFRLFGILASASVVGIACIVATMLSVNIQNSNFEHDVALQKIENEKHRAIIVNGLKRAKIDSILLIVEKTQSSNDSCASGYLLFKKFADSIEVLNGNKYCNANSDSIAKMLIQYWPLSIIRREYTWSDTISNLKTIVTTANGAINEYDSIAPDAARQDVCHRELSHKLLWIIPLPVDYSDLDGCIKTCSIEFKETKVITENRRITEDTVAPFLISKNGQTQLRYRRDQ